MSFSSAHSLIRSYRQELRLVLALVGVEGGGVRVFVQSGSNDVVLSAINVTANFNSVVGGLSGGETFDHFQKLVSLWVTVGIASGTTSGPCAKKGKNTQPNHHN